jgi:hypothetical protein
MTALGEGVKPVLIVQVPKLLGLLEGLGLAEQPGLSEALPYLRALGTVTAGRARPASGRKRLRIVAGLR